MSVEMHNHGGGGKMRKVIMGNHALSFGAKLGRAQVIAAYPITPQTQVVELLSEMCADKTLDAKFIKVESEHSAMAACLGASLAGARTFTATSAQGLALMHELLHWASGGRLPVVMGNINRAMAPGWSIWSDQNDSLSQRDTGWMQFYCASNQEVLDTVIQAFKVSEKLLIPSMVILDAFTLSHTYEVVDIPDQEKQVPLFGFIAGLGGRDITPLTFKEIAHRTLENEKPKEEIIWIGVNRLGKKRE